jgi:shikimate dehydrogenase
VKIYGLIGYPLTHSFSQKYFSDKFLREGIANSEYRNFPIAEISGLPQLLADNPDLVGLNVTIPYKEQVLQFLKELDVTVDQIRACNCISMQAGAMKGYNTDVTGFRLSLEPLLTSSHTHALVLGRGGAAKAVNYVLDSLGIERTTVVREWRNQGELVFSELDRNILSKHKLIINTTPLGTFPNVSEFPPIPYQFIDGSHLLFDLIYNPEKTAFLMQGEQRGARIKNGYEMLVLQAEAAWKIWNE